MDWYRLRHTLGMCFTLSAMKRAEYIKKHDIFYHMGNNCMVMFRKIPLYPKLISFGDNVWVASNVAFITHDVIHCMLNFREGAGLFPEKIGCIDVRDNVFIGANTTILPDVIIGPDTIIAAGSLVNKDIPGGGVYGGMPAKRICSLDDFVEKRSKERGKTGLSDATIENCWRRFNKRSSV